MFDELIEKLEQKEKSTPTYIVDPNVFNATYVPDNIYAREEEISKIYNYFISPLINGLNPANLLIKGFTGTGKTLVVKNTIDYLTRKNVNAEFFYIGCMVGNEPKTTYEVLIQLFKKIGKKVSRGNSTNDLILKFFEITATEEKNFIFIFDEVDSFLKKNGSGFFYSLLRASEDVPNFKPKVSIIGISNKGSISHMLDPRVKSALNSVEIAFPQYNAMDLNKILDDRTKKGLNPSVLTNEFVPMISAYASKNGGDARKAILTIKKSCELAKEQALEVIENKVIEQAYELVREEDYLNAILSLGLVHKYILLAFFATSIVNRKGKTESIAVDTSSIYTKYVQLYKDNTGSAPYSLSRIKDFLHELEMSEFIETATKYLGRGGRKKVYYLEDGGLLGRVARETLYNELGIQTVKLNF